MITEQQSQAIDYIIEGQNKTSIAKLVGVSRNTLYNWLELKEFQEEKQKRLDELKVVARNKISTKVNNCIDIIYEIAVTSKDTRTKFQAAKYLCDQYIGSPTTDKGEIEGSKTIEVTLDD
ncbi:phBC6A51 family helix-turn-helix protein [Clostridium tertium]|uniref:phBC6A51 family helix-turn-helix protein n=1 Tax=Clostridium tertium TaxID=1559 RepID=UPI000C08B924|nr:phBC6A51 family helix-turn-helix protein [Clostridium tertium]